MDFWLQVSGHFQPVTINEPTDWSLWRFALSTLQPCVCFVWCRREAVCLPNLWQTLHAFWPPQQARAAPPGVRAWHDQEDVSQEGGIPEWWELCDVQYQCLLPSPYSDFSRLLAHLTSGQRTTLTMNMSVALGHTAHTVLTHSMERVVMDTWSATCSSDKHVQLP